MRHSRLFLVQALLLMLVICASQGVAQKSNPCTTQTDFSNWFDCMASEVAAPILNQRDNTKQVELPSIAENTTSLVDQPGNPDLLGAVLNMAGIGKSSNDKNNASGTITISAYALSALTSKKDALDPALYSENGSRNLRRFSFTFGQDSDESGKRTTVLGTKILIINYRDASLGRNRSRLLSVSQALRASAADYAKIAFDVQEYLYLHLAPPGKDRFPFLNEDLNGSNLQPTLSRLTDEQLNGIKAIIAKRIQSHVELSETSKKTYEEIRRAPQLSFTIQSKLRSKDGNDEYRAGLLFDYGVYQRINLTLNGTFDYQNSGIIGGDKRGGRFAAETNFQLTPEKYFLGAGRPFLFSISGSGEWLTKTRPKYIGQAKLTIPIFNGVNFPISISVANRSDLIKESKVRGHFGFTLDLAKLLSKPK